MDRQTLQEFEAAIRGKVPGFRVAFKDESWLHSVISFLVSPFNPNYMSFTTTLGKTVWFPSRIDYHQSALWSFIILAHEYVHMYDSRKEKLWGWRYLYPQVLALPLFLAFAMVAGWNSWILALPLLGYTIGCLSERLSVFCVITGMFTLAAILVALHFTGLWTILLCLGVLALAPWPAPYRAEAEYRAYAMSMAVLKWRRVIWASSIDFTSYFIGPDYYFMCWNPGKVRLRLSAFDKAIRDGGLQQQEPYAFVYRFMQERGLSR